MGTIVMVYKRPVIQILDTLDAFFAQLLPRKFSVSACTDWRAQKLKEFIDRHSGRLAWNLDDICRELNLSMSGRQARRLFKGSTGIGIKEYAKSMRLAAAAEQLQTTNVPVKAIAADFGYKRTADFARSFKELFRVTPLEFRSVWRKSEVAA